MSRRYFSVAEANRTLPLVRRIVTDIVREYAEWKELVARYEILAADTGAREPPERVEVRHRIERHAEHIAGFMDELSSVGCLFKGFDEGLVDFYSRRDDRDILLCWKLGEASVGYWHEIEAGFAGRQVLAPQMAGGGD